MSKQHTLRKYGNAVRAYAFHLRRFKGVGFMRTQTAQGIIPRIKRWSARLT